MQTLNVPAFTREIADEVKAIAQTLPYRAALGIDSERVFWVVVANDERIGIAWSPDDPAGPHWMIAIAHADHRKVRRARIREIVDLVAGYGARYELAPAFEAVPQMTMVRVRSE